MYYTIIIPVYNDPIIKDCLNSLVHLNTKLSFEVIVVENSKTNWIRPLVTSFGFRYVEEPITGSYRARNTGLREAKGDIIVFTDSDCVVSPNWLDTIHASLQDASVDGVMGYSAGAVSTTVAGYEQTMYEANIGKFTQTAELKRVDTRNLAVKRAVFERVGGFMEGMQYGGDMEFGARAHAAGFNMTYNVTMRLTHHNVKQLKPLLYKRVRQNYGNMMLVQVYDRSYIMNYFPHLLRFQATSANWWKLHGLQILLQLNMWCCDVVVKLLPKSLGYTYFKVLNVAAMRVGQLQFVFGLQPW